MTDLDKLPDGSTANESGGDLLTEEQLAAEKDCPFSPNTLREYRRTGKGPPYYKIGRYVHYDLDEYRAWARSRRYRSTSEESANAGAS